MLGHALEGAGVAQGRNVSLLGDLLLAMEVKSAQVVVVGGQRPWFKTPHIVPTVVHPVA
jgi:hypothetical protein